MPPSPSTADVLVSTCLASSLPPSLPFSTSGLDFVSSFLSLLTTPITPAALPARCMSSSPPVSTTCSSPVRLARTCSSEWLSPSANKPVGNWPVASSLGSGSRLDTVEAEATPAPARAPIAAASPRLISSSSSTMLARDTDRRAVITFVGKF